MSVQHKVSSFSDLTSDDFSDFNSWAVMSSLFSKITEKVIETSRLPVSMEIAIHLVFPGMLAKYAAQSGRGENEDFQVEDGEVVSQLDPEEAKYLGGALSYLFNEIEKVTKVHSENRFIDENPEAVTVAGATINVEDLRMGMVRDEELYILLNNIIGKGWGLYDPTKLVFDSSTFTKLVKREIWDMWNACSIDPEAVLYIQFSIETKLKNLIREAWVFMAHTKKKTLMPKDLQCASYHSDLSDTTFPQSIFPKTPFPNDLRGDFYPCDSRIEKLCKSIDKINRISGLIHEELRGHLSLFLKQILFKTLLFTLGRGGDCVEVGDVVKAEPLIVYPNV